MENVCMWHHIAAVCPVAVDRALHDVAAGGQLRAGRINCPQKRVTQVSFQTY